MNLTRTHLLQLRTVAIEAAVRAGDLIESLASADLEVGWKDGGASLAAQVVTEADRRAQALIVGHLQEGAADFDFGLLAEESADDRSRFEKDFFWCVDPLDGTLPFTEGRSGYAVSIALVSQRGESLVGVVYDPREQTLYDAARGLGARRNQRSWRLDEWPPADSLTLFADRSLLEDRRIEPVKQAMEALAYERGLSGVELVAHGGAAMNALWTLEKGPACYFKFPKEGKGGGSLWDFAATSCLFGELGGCFGDVFGEPLELNRQESTFLNHRGVCCASDARLGDSVRQLLGRLLEF